MSVCGCAGDEHMSSHSHVYRERNVENACRNVHVCSLIFAARWETWVYNICARARAQHSEKHEADSAQYTNMWLKIDRHKIGR